MQKKLIAAAVATLMSGAAMAQVTIYGRLDIGYSQDTQEVTGSAKQTDSDTGYQSALTTSRLGFNVSEDLGDGLTAFGNLELGINALGSEQGRDTSAGVTSASVADNNLNAAPDSNNAGVPFNTRTAYVGLKSASAGTLTLGRQWVLVDQVMGLGSGGGLNNTVGNLYNNLGKLNNTRSSSLIQYVSPKFSGFDVSLAYGKGSDEINEGSGAAAQSSSAEHEETGLRVQFSTGNLNVALGYSSEEFTPTTGGAATSEPTQLALAANYDFGVVKAFALYTKGENTAGTNQIDSREGFELGVNVPLGNLQLLATVYQGETDNITSNDTDHEGYQIGAKYSLSKRTTAYALYGADEATTNVTNSVTEKNQLAIGVAHTF